MLSKALCMKEKSVQLLSAAARSQLVSNEAKALCFLWISISEQQCIPEGQSDNHLSPLTSSLSQLPRALPVIILEHYDNAANKWSTHR